MIKKPSVVLIGGGTGTHTVLRGLKRYSDRINITSIVTMADSGGSTGRLRDEFGTLPVGDVRMALAALAGDNGHSELLLRDLFLYRFEQGDGLKGHNLGNLLLTALTDILGSEDKAVMAASSILRVSGVVLPVTTDNVQLVAEYDDGLVVEGEHLIDDPPKDRLLKRIVKLRTEPVAVVNSSAAEAIRSADLIVLGPGDLYSSLLANCVVFGVPEAISTSKAKFVFVSNLMERPGQTTGMSVGEIVKELEKYISRLPDAVLINNTPLPQETVDWYKTKDGTKPVIDDLDEVKEVKAVRMDLISNGVVVQNASDQVQRSLIRHDSNKLAAAIIKSIP